MTPEPRRRARSAAAVLAGFFVVFLLSLGTDEILHSFEVFPPWGEPMHDPGLNLLALSYRCVYAVIGSYLAASLAPYARMGHALALGAIGFVLGSAGAAVAITQANLGPSWYPVALALSALPCAWLGGALERAS